MNGYYYDPYADEYYKCPRQDCYGEMKEVSHPSGNWKLDYWVCDSCGKEIHPKFCDYCGKSIQTGSLCSTCQFEEEKAYYEDHSTEDFY